MLKGRILGVDFGLRRIGLAISDPCLYRYALDNLEAGPPVKTSATHFHHLEKLKKEKGYNVAEIVIGLPLHMNGQESERSTPCTRICSACS